MERIDAEVRRELGRFGPQGGMPELLEAWPAVVGPMVAASAWPARFARDGTLHVNTSSSAWAFELAQLAPAITEKLQAALGTSAPSSLRFAVGHLPEPAREEGAGRRSEVPEPGAEALERAGELAAAIEDDELRNLVQRAVAFGLARAPSDLPF